MIESKPTQQDIDRAHDFNRFVDKTDIIAQNEASALLNMPNSKRDSHKGEWTMHDSYFFDYRVVQVLRKHPEHDLKSHIEQFNGQANILDLCAGAGGGRDEGLHYDKWIGAGLTDTRTKKQKIEDAEKGIKVSTGNLALQSAWDSIDAAGDGELFNLIISNPGMAWDTLDNMKNHTIQTIYYKTLWRSINRLAINGKLAIKLERPFSQNSPEMTFEERKQKEAIAIEAFHYFAKITNKHNWGLKVSIISGNIYGDKTLSDIFIVDRIGNIPDGNEIQRILEEEGVFDKFRRVEQFDQKIRDQSLQTK